MDWMWRPNNLAPSSPDLAPLDFFLWGYKQRLRYETLVETQHDLVARIAVAAGTIWEMQGILHRFQHNIARWCRICNGVSGYHFEQML
jgi:hypothetical protein